MLSLVGGLTYIDVMFLRRRKITVPARLREFLWPRMGWARSFSYLYHRLARIAGTPSFIAAGFACGAAISFTPFVGMHIALAVGLAWLLRASIVAAVIGTVVGNPWTFPIIWFETYELGNWLLGAGGAHSANVDFVRFFASLFRAALHFDIVYLFETAWPVWWPMIVGGLPTAVVAWVVSYQLLRPFVSAYQKRRQRLRVKKKIGEPT